MFGTPDLVVVGVVVVSVVVVSVVVDAVGGGSSADPSAAKNPAVRRAQQLTASSTFNFMVVPLTSTRSG
jgi:hypothetical protein